MLTLLHQAMLQHHETKIQITFSSGIAALSSDEEVALEQLIERAEKALYLAKEKRNGMAYWDDQESKPRRIV